MNWKDYKFRASSIYKIMTDSKSKSDPIGETCKKYLLDCYVSQVYGRDRELINKYISKGLEVEDDSMTLYCRSIGKILFKNKERFENEYICGTPDIIEDNCILDIKSSWSMHTFFDVFVNSLKKAYFYQLQSYMALTNKSNAKLVYCLVDTPQPLINDELRRLQWDMGVSDPSANEVYQKAAEYLEFSLKFNDVPMSDRFVEFEIRRDDAVIDAIYKRVDECRDFLQEIDNRKTKKL